MSRPGVATMMSRPALIFLIWASMGAPPYTGAKSSRRPRGRANGRSSSATCKASSRVGTRIRPRTQWESARERFSTIGRPKARVLPERFGFAAHVLAGERIGDGQGLDGKRGVDAPLVERRHQV